MLQSQDEDAPTIEVAYCGTKSLEKIIPPSVLSLKAPAGAYRISGENAYQSLPLNWRGICSLGYMIHMTEAVEPVISLELYSVNMELCLLWTRLPIYQSWSRS